MKQTTRAILFGLSCAGVGAGITGMYMEVKRAEEQTELMKIMYEGCIDMYKKLLEPPTRPRYSDYGRRRYTPYCDASDELAAKEKKDETMA